MSTDGTAPAPRARKLLDVLQERKAKFDISKVVFFASHRIFNRLTPSLSCEPKK